MRKTGKIQAKIHLRSIRKEKMTGVLNITPFNIPVIRALESNHVSLRR